MNRDELLSALANTAQEQAVQDAARYDERWDRLSRGALAAQELEALRAEVADSPELSAAIEAFTPLGGDFEERATDAIMAQLAPAADAPAAKTDRESDPMQSDNVVPMRRRQRPGWTPLALAASVMAAVALGLILRPGGESMVLPGYGLTLEGVTKTYRGSDTERIDNNFATGNRFSLLLTPELPAEGELTLRLYTWTDEGLQAMSAPAPRISTDGAVLVEGIVGTDVQLPRGESQLVIALGHAGKLPDKAELTLKLRDRDAAQDEHWSAWKLLVSSR